MADNLPGKLIRSASWSEISNRLSPSENSNTKLLILDRCVKEINICRQDDWRPVEPNDRENRHVTRWKDCHCCHQSQGRKLCLDLQQKATENKETQTINGDESMRIIIEEIFERFLNSYLGYTELKSTVGKPKMMLKDIKYFDKSDIFYPTIENKMESLFESQKGDQGHKKQKDLIQFLLTRLQWLQPVNIHAYPVKDCSKSLEEFVTKELSVTQSSVSPTGSSSASELHSMNMEMIRVSTYSGFPLASSVSTVRLAKEGFYYTGEGDSVVCFACGLQRHGWEPADDPRDVHQQMSPNCTFLNSKQSKNIPFGENETFGNQSALNMSIRENERTYSPVSQRPEVLSQNSTPASSKRESKHSDKSVSSAQNNTAVPSSSSHREDMEQNAGSNQERPKIKTAHQKAREKQEKINKFIRSLDPLGINSDRPKYPSYAVVAIRVSSYEDWPSSIMQKPRDLAIAGFVYAGYGDYTRCFFCGGGLRNWEPQDDPWTEHARWFPKCAFLRQNKGDEFVAMVQVEHEEKEELATMERAEKSSSSNTSNASTIPGTELENATLTDIFELSSVQSVLQMGYPQQVVKEAFELLKVTKHVEEISGEDIMDVILSNEENATTLENSFTTHDTSRRTGETVRLEILSPPNQSDEERVPLSTSSRPTPSSTDDPRAVTGASHDNPKHESLDTQSLIEEYKELKNLRVCKICIENDASIAMLPCGHLCCCPDCAPAMKKCPICQQFVKGTVRTWLA